MESNTITIPSSIPDQLTVDDEVMSVQIITDNPDEEEAVSNSLHELEAPDPLTLTGTSVSLTGNIDTSSLTGHHMVHAVTLSENSDVDSALVFFTIYHFMLLIHFICTAKTLLYLGNINVLIV